MNKNYAIFDMDGTLLDSMGYWKGLAAEYLRAKGVDPIPEDVIRRIKPLTMTESAELFISEFHLPGTPESVAREMNELMGVHYMNDVSLKLGAEEYLEVLRLRGVRMCVVTATAGYLAQCCLERYGILHYFDFILSCEDIGLGKDRPDIYRIAAERYGAEPSEIAVYEDAFYAANTAKSTGYYLAGVYDEVSGRRWQEICDIADELITDWRAKAKELMGS